jgi:DIE2/ALG10 family
MVNSSVTKVESASPCSTDSPEDHSPSPRNGLICASLLAISVLIIYPVANMPFGDDFSYTKTALVFEQTGRIVYNGWATAMLGWLIPWGAACIKIFGFSFTLLRLAMLPLGLATVYIFHQILRRFGINRRNAVFGTLTLALSPLFLFMTASYMTDLPGLLVLLVCLYMCQRAVAARSDRAAILWLCSAALVNVAGGTVRQIAWLGALVMVPSTAWLLRKQRGMKAVGVVMWFFGLAGVIVCLHWFSKQPYSVPEHILGNSIRIRQLAHLVLELTKTLLCLLLIIFPIAVAWLPTARRLPPQAKLRIAMAIAALALLAVIFYKTGALGRWTEPWLIPFLAASTLGTMPLW